MYLYTVQRESLVGGKFGEFGKLSMIHQTKPSKLVLTINNLLADLLICQTFFCQRLEQSQFTKLSPRQTFPLYGMYQKVWVLTILLSPSLLAACTSNISYFDFSDQQVLITMARFCLNHLLFQKRRVVQTYIHSSMMDLSSAITFIATSFSSQLAT